MEFIFYTPQEVAKLLKLNVLTIYEYIKSGDLIAIRFGRNYRIDAQDLSIFLKKHKMKSSNLND